MHYDPLSDSAKRRRSAKWRSPKYACQFWPKRFLEQCPKPIQDERIMRLCDGNTRIGFTKAIPGIQVAEIGYSNPLETVNFMGGGAQVSAWITWTNFARLHKGTLMAVPWRAMQVVYGPDLVSEMKGFYGE